jgi:uncharacterized iron-regulated membrane protein
VTVHTIWLRRIHKWVGLVIGIQVLLWAVSGAMMAILDMDEVAGGQKRSQPPFAERAASRDGWEDVGRQLGGTPIIGVRLGRLLGRQVYHVTTSRGVRVYDAETGRRVSIDAPLAERVARASHPDDALVRKVAPLDRLTFAVRDHELPIWRADFEDSTNSSYYVSGTTGDLLERRNDSWRLWDFFWMLHTMDYAKRTSFNHPLIVVFAFAAVWLTITGLWLLFRTGWRSDFKNLKRRG